MRTFDVLYNIASHVVSEFIASHPIDPAQKKPTDANILIVLPFKEFSLPTLLERRDLFQLRAAFIELQQKLMLSAGDVVSEQFEQNLRDAIQKISTFECYYSAIDERLNQYVSKNEGSWIAEASTILSQLEKNRVGFSLSAFKEAIQDLCHTHLQRPSMLGTIVSKRLKPDLEAILAEIPSKRYAEAQEQAQRYNQPHHVFEIYQGLISKTLNNSLQKNDGWEARIQSILAKLSEVALSKNLWEMKDVIQAECDFQLTPSMISLSHEPGVKAEIKGILAEIPSKRYAETQKPISDNPSKVLSHSVVPPSSDAGSSSLNDALMARLAELTERVSELELRQQSSPMLLVAANQPAPGAIAQEQTPESGKKQKKRR